MRIAIGLLVTGLLACSRRDQRGARDSDAEPRISRRCDAATSDRDTTCKLFGPSLIELIARPEVYDAKRVRVIGYANLEFEGNALYVSREDFEHMIMRNGLWLDVPDSLASRHATRLPGYVLVEGEFSAGNHGHLGLWAGALGHITRFEPTPSRATIDSMLRRVRPR